MLGQGRGLESNTFAKVILRKTDCHTLEFAYLVYNLVLPVANLLYLYMNLSYDLRGWRYCLSILTVSMKQYLMKEYHSSCIDYT